MVAGPTYQTEECASFKLGMDCRPILLNNNLETFREQVNVLTTNEGFPMRRPPVVQPGTIGAFCQGYIRNNGIYYTLCRLGDTPGPSFAQVLYFNNPENCLTTWKLLWVKVFEQKITACIRHDFPGSTITSRMYIHQWDLIANLPTYLSDQFAPWDWGPDGFPTNAYSAQGTISGKWTPFTPVAEIGAEHIWMGNDLNDLPFCAIGRSRVWNAQAVSDIEKSGTMYYFTVPSTAVNGITSYTTPETFSDFDASPWTVTGTSGANDKIVAYVLEVLAAKGQWTKITEVKANPAPGQFALVAVTVPWSSNQVAQIQANGLAVDALIRLRVLMIPEVAIVSGAEFLPQNETYTGDGSSTSWPSKETFLGFTGYSVLVNNNLKAITTYYTVANVNGLAVVNFNSFVQASTLGTLSLGAVTPGTGYTSLPSLALSGNSGGTAAAATVTNLQAVAAVVAAGGTGYSVNDILTCTGDTGTAVQVKVLTLGASNAVATVSIQTAGALTVVSANPHSTTGGTGTACTLTVTYGIGAVALGNIGYGYQTATSFVASGGGGSGGSVAVTVNQPVGVTGIAYSAATDPDFGGITVYINGVLSVDGVGYTLLNVGGIAYVLPSTPLPIGTALVAALIVPLGTSIQFTTPALAIGAGVITYEGSNQNSTVQSVAALPNGSYFISVTANGVVQYHLIGSWWDGLSRYQSFIVGTVTVLGGVITVSAPFLYGYLSLNAYYVQRHQVNLDYWSGENETGALDTASHDVSGGILSALVATKNRMLVCYPKASQLWQIDPVPTNNDFLDKSQYGSSYMGVLFHDQPMVLGERAWRSFALTGLSFQALDDQDIGASIEDLGQFTLQWAEFWPWFGCYVAFVSISNTQAYAIKAKLPKTSVFQSSGPVYGFMFLSFAKEKGIQAWSFCPVAGITSVSTIIADGSKLYFLSGSTVYAFDALATVVQDATDPVVKGKVVPFQHSAIWHLYDFNHKKGAVRVLHCEVTQVGTCSFSISSMPWNARVESKFATITDVQMGKLRMPLKTTGRAIALHAFGNVPDQWILQKVSFNVMPLGR